MFNWIVRNPTALIPKPMLTRSGLQPRDYLSWKSVIMAQDWDVLVEHLAQKDVSSPEVHATQDQDASGRQQPPTWVVLYALCYKVKSESDAWKALALVYSHLPVASPHLRPALLMLAACWLAEHDLLVPLQRVVNAFSHGDHGVELQDFHYQLLLQLIAYASSSDRISPVLRRIIDNLGDYPLNRPTFDALLRSPCANPTLGLAVARKMRAQDYPPTLRHLTQLVLLYSQAGWQRRARMVMRAVRLHMAEAKGEEVPIDSDLRRVGDAVPMLVRAESRFLASFPSAEALHTHLQESVAGDSADPDTEGDIDDTDGVGMESQPSDSSIESHPYDNLPSGGASALIRTAPAWASVVVVASKDRSSPSEQLSTVYQRALEAHPSLSRDTHMHMSVIKGFLLRENYTSAVEVWNQLREHKTLMTKEVLTIGVEVLTLAGQPLKALDLLYDRTELLEKKGVRGEEARSLIDTRMANTFMVSLQTAGFTDIIFVLWERMGELFDVRPDVYSFSILLKTARLASKCNPSFRGALAEIGLSNFLGKDRAAEDLTRNDYFLEAEMAINREAMKGSCGLWNGERAGLVALRVAREIIFNNWPELQDVPSPAQALRPTGDFQGSFPMTSLLRTVLRRQTPPPPSPSPSPSRTAALPYPGIILNDVVFRAFIDLLASEAQIPQIPLALAWMRTLGIRPSQGTLATALVYWAEVGMDAPLFEHFRSSGASQYERLKRWMVEWVGPAAMPTDKHIAGHMHRYKLFKELSRRPRVDPDA
ncbi:hypothetical protein C8Q72DRAFT_891177 [Fomitopsis betulina]|nr:hypothetical protein C8Q72DRAFT_891177 [Fomitopsis betulina]